jgi:hypothetical protein
LHCGQEGASQYRPISSLFVSTLSQADPLLESICLSSRVGQFLQLMMAHYVSLEHSQIGPRSDPGLARLMVVNCVEKGAVEELVLLVVVVHGSRAAPGVHSAAALEGNAGGWMATEGEAAVLVGTKTRAGVDSAAQRDLRPETWALEAMPARRNALALAQWHTFAVDFSFARHAD